MRKIVCGILSLLMVLSVLYAPASAFVELGDGAGYFGDVNLDYSYNSVDALLALKNAVGKAHLTAKQIKAADVNCDGAVNAQDALLILRYSVQTLEEWPGGDAYDSYTLSDYAYQDPDSVYKAYEAGDFDYNTSLSVNGAYATDSTADCSFVMDNTGLQPKTIYVFGAEVITNNDIARLAFSLQGLINRDFGRDSGHTSVVYISLEGSDSNWLEYIMEEGSVFAGYEIVRILSWDAFYTTFEHQLQYCGIIGWDGNVPATSNVAATICGLDGYLPVLAKSPLYDELLAKGVTEKQSLVGLFENGKKGEKITGTDIASTGSAKNDAYRWAMEKYFDRCTSNFLAYTLDGGCTIRGYEAYEDNPTALLRDAGLTCLSNHDYLIARRCFFFDLYPYTDEVCDDPAQQYVTIVHCTECGEANQYDLDDLLGEDDPVCAYCAQTFKVDFDEITSTSMAELGTDNETMLMIFDRRYQRAKGAIGQLMGFPPWWAKYTTHSNQGTQAATWIEWLYCEYVTCYNMAKEADAAQPASMTNGSVYYKYVPRYAEYDNKREEYDAGVTYSDDTLYFTIYMGDYDSSAWLKTYVNNFFIHEDRARATLPLTWCFNPNLSNRVPMAFDYIYSHKYEHEFFAAGDSGAGYVIPSGLYGGHEMAYTRQTRPASYANGDTMWANYCKKFYERFDMTATGFIINGSNAMTTDILGMFNTFSTSGGLHNCGNALMTQYKGVPYVYCQNGIGTETDLSSIYEHAFTRMAGYNFAAYRTVCISPSNVNRVITRFTSYAEGKGKKAQYAELYTFLDLAKESGQGYVVN